MPDVSNSSLAITMDLSIDKPTLCKWLYLSLDVSSLAPVSFIISAFFVSNGLWNEEENAKANAAIVLEFKDFSELRFFFDGGFQIHARAGYYLRSVLCYQTKK